MIFSNIFLNSHKLAIGLVSDGITGALTFESGRISACFQAHGKYARSMQLLNNAKSKFPMIGRALVIEKRDRWSGPEVKFQEDDSLIVWTTLFNAIKEKFN